MLSNEYQAAAMRTATSNEGANTPEQRLLNATLGLIGESGEIADSIATDDAYVNAILALAANVGMLADNAKKTIYHGHAFDRDDALLTLDLVANALENLETFVIGWNCEAPNVDRVTTDEKAHLEKEAGDVLWYTALLATAINTPLAQIMRGNIAKLQRRYPTGFSADASRNRSGNE